MNEFERIQCKSCKAITVVKWWSFKGVGKKCKGCGIALHSYKKNYWVLK